MSGKSKQTKQQTANAAGKSRMSGIQPAGRPEKSEEARERHFYNVLRHIKNVQEAAKLLGERLIDRGEKDLGRILIANSMIHDNSKFFGIEWEYMSAEETNKEKLQLAVLQHVTTNPHHPEYWGDIKDMPRIYLAEMVCDWHARSVEFGTDLRDWIKNAALEKYGITTQTKVYKTIKEFVDLLLDNPFS